MNNQHKTLADLTAADWGRLFPIQLVAYDHCWPDVYTVEHEAIADQLGSDVALRIEHFGSTSIPGLVAKPIIDLLIEIPFELLFDERIIDKMTQLGYHFFRQSGNGADYMVLVKGYHPNGEKDQLFHIHMCTGDHILWDQIAFRDFLRNNPERASAYEALKIKLAQEYENDRVGYRMAKSDFISETISQSKKNL